LLIENGYPYSLATASSSFHFNLRNTLASTTGHMLNQRRSYFFVSNVDLNTSFWILVVRMTEERTEAIVMGL